MTYAPDADPDTLVDAALAEAAILTSDPVARAWCQAYRYRAEGGFSEAAARAALESIWPELLAIPIEDVHRLMEDDVPRDVGEHGASRWAMAGAARAALELIRVRTGLGDVERASVGFVTPAPSVRTPGPEVVRYREKEAGRVAFMALQFAETAKAHRMASPEHPPRLRFT